MVNAIPARISKSAEDVGGDLSSKL